MLENNLIKIVFDDIPDTNAIVSNICEMDDYQIFKVNSKENLILNVLLEQFGDEEIEAVKIMLKYNENEEFYVDISQGVNFNFK